jgi:hypothetical protein
MNSAVHTPCPLCTPHLQGMLYYYSHRDSLLSLTHKASKPKNTVSLITSTVKLDDEEHTLRFAFRWGSRHTCAYLSQVRGMCTQDGIFCTCLYAGQCLNGILWVVSRAPCSLPHASVL